MSVVCVDSETRVELRTLQAGDLQGRVLGPVIDPCHPAYDEARRPWNLTLDQHPALILMAEDGDDVVAGVRFATDHGLGVAVQATGHGVREPADGALMINTSRMAGVEVDPEARTAYVEAGAKWGPVLAAAQAHGLAPLLGSSPDVGAVGYTLGGGFGWLGRKYGLSTDSVRFFDVVLADGSRLRASADENADLFWGLRGGGGSLGVVVGMEIALYPVTTVYAGNLLYPLEAARDVFARYVDWITSVPEELTSSIVLMNFPPLPMVPEPLRGQSYVMVRGCYAGPLAEGQALIQSWRAWRAPEIDMFVPMPFTESARISSDPEDPMPARATGGWLRDLGPEVADTLIRFAAPAGGPPVLAFLEVRHAGGAIKRVDPDAAAYTHRNHELLMDAVAMAPTPDAAAHVAQHIAALKAALGPHLAEGVYMNFLEGEEARARIADGYSPEAYGRLRALKTIVDPTNLFRYSHAIEPFGEDDRGCES